MSIPPSDSPPRRRFRLRFLLVAVISVTVLLAAVVILVRVLPILTPERLTRFALDRFSTTLNMPVAVWEVEVHPGSGDFVLTGVQVGREPSPFGPAPPVYSVERIEGRLGWGSWIPARVDLNELRVEGVSVRGFDDGATPPPGTERPPNAFLAGLVGSMSFSSDRVEVSGTTIGYRNRVTPWEVRVDDLRMEVRPAGGAEMDASVRFGIGAIRLWERPDLAMEIEGELRIRNNLLHVDRMDLRSGLLEAAVVGTLDLANDLDGPLQLTGSGDAGALGRLLFEFEDLETMEEPWFAFDWIGRFEEVGFVLDGSFTLPSGRFHGVPLRDWNGVLHWDPERVEILSSEGTLAGGAATLRLRQVQPREENPASLELDVRGGSLSSALAGLFGLPTTLMSSVDLEADLRMPLSDPLAMVGAITAAGIRPDPPPETGSGPAPLGIDLSARLSIDEEAMTIHDVSVEGPAFQARGEGFYHRGRGAEVVVTGIAGEMAEVDLVQQEFRRVVFGEAPETTFWDVAGGGAVEGRVTGPWPDLVMSGEVEGRGMRFSAIRADTLIATGEVGPESTRIENLNARAGDGRITASGVFARQPAVDADMTFEASWEDWDAAEIIAFLEWDILAEGMVTGTSRTIRKDGRYTGGGMLSGHDGSFLEQPFDDLRLEWQMDGDAATLAPMEANFRGGAASGDLRIGLVEWEMEGAVAGSDYPLTPGLAPEWITIRSDFELDVGGDLLVPELDFHARVPDAAVMGLSLGPGEIRAAVRGETYTGSGMLDSGAARFEVRGTVPVGTDGQATIEVTDVDIASLLVPDARERGIEVVVAGTGAFHLEQPHDEWMTGAGSLSRFRVTAPGLRVASTGPTRIVVEEARVHVEGFEAARGEDRFRLSGSVGLEDTLMDLRVGGNLSLAALGNLVTGLSFGGDFAVEAEVRGPWDTPEFFGRGRIGDGSVRIDGFPHTFRDIAGDILFDSDVVRITELAGEVASGPTLVSGNVSLDGFEIGAMDLRVQLTDARIRYPLDLLATVDADLSIAGEPDGRLLSGTVRLDEAVWSREYELFSNIFSDVISVSGPDLGDEGDALGGLRLDVRVETGSPFEVENSIFRLQAAADLDLRGTTDSPAVLGRADLVGGEVYFGANRFGVVAGRADFVDPGGIEPVFDIEAESIVRSYRIRLRASGTPEQIEANLSSDPPLREADILRLLSGASEEELLTARSDDEVAAASAATLLTQTLSGSIGRRAGRVFGIDRISVDPFLIGRFGDPTARITLGKQVSRDLSVRYSSSFSETDEAIIIVEYTPEGPVSWVLSRDQDGSLGLDVRFHRSF